MERRGLCLGSTENMVESWCCVYERSVRGKMLRGLVEHFMVEGVCWRLTRACRLGASV
jgi:hypothetical protein